MDLSIKTVPAIRSTQGCWTCRLRRKKCDETPDTCLRCASVDVKCCYGPKPRWMENGALAKEELERIKIIISKSARRKRAAYRTKNRTVPETSSPHSTQLGRQSSVGVLPDQAQEVSAPIQSLPPPGDAVDRVLPPAREIPKRFLYLNWMEDHEASLMMHYLDHVFFIQFRFHIPSVSAGGRGWLLSLLTRTKPLYHAALSLSAFHQQSLLCLDEDSGQAQIDTLQELERHHNLTLQELQLFIHAHGEVGNERRRFGGNIQILACMVQLISFELFNGGTSNWEMHLRAASDLVLTLHGIRDDHRMEHSASERDRRSSSYLHSGDRPSTGRPPSSEHAALNFLTGAIIWFDVLACVATASQSYLYDYHSRLLSLETTSTSSDTKICSKVELHTIMGCQNWVMVIISDIARLGQQRSMAALSLQQVVDRKEEIEQDLDKQDAQVRQSLDDIRGQFDGGHPPASLPDIYNKHTVFVITHIFACAAKMYLHNATSSRFPSSLMQKTISALRLIPDPRMMRGLVWPLCVAGCMAQTPSDQAFFRNLTGNAVSDSRSFGNSGQALEILEMSWRLQRDRGEPVDCTACIRQMGTCVLLV